jgi:UPF0755 protein
MTSFNNYTPRRRRLPRRILGIILVLIILAVASMFVVHHVYNADLEAVSASQTTQVVTIETGSSSKQIADQLAKAHLIRSAWAFELYVHSKELGSQLQAGTYALSPNQSTAEIIATLTRGNVTASLVTVLPGRRIDQVRADLINSGFSPTDVDQALTNLNQYSDLPVMAFKPAGVTTLEGLLWPNSWYRDANSSASDIVRKSLAETPSHITPDIQAAFAQEGLSTYQGLVLASILEKEVSKPSDRAQAAQVFLSRLHNGSSLGSDVTAIYGAIAAGKTDYSQAQMLAYNSPYNTLINTGLPPTPISSVSDSSLAAAAHPAATQWLYFVSGDNGSTYFAKTLDEHNQQTAQYCHKLCGQ